MEEKSEKLSLSKEVLKASLKAIVAIIIVFSLLYTLDRYRAEITTLQGLPGSLRFMDLFYPISYFILLRAFSDVASKMKGVYWDSISVSAIAGGWILLLWGVLDFYGGLYRPTGVENFVSPSTLKMPLAFMIVGLYTFRFCNSESKYHGILAPIEGVGVLLMIYGVHMIVMNLGFNQLSVIFIPVYIFTALVYGLSTLALHRNERIKNLGKRFQEMTGQFVIGGALIGVYVYLRSSISFPYLQLLEYGAAFFIIAKAASGVYTHLNGIDRIEETLSKHVQKVEYIKNPDFARFEKSIHKFITEGDKVPITVDIVTVLHDLGVSNDKIQSVIDPIIEYQDMELPLFGFKWEIERAIKENMEDRRDVLSEVFSDPVFTGSPLEGGTDEGEREM